MPHDRPHDRPHDDRESHGHAPRDGLHTSSTADLASTRPEGFDADPAAPPRPPFNDALPAPDPADPSPSHRPPELDPAHFDAGGRRAG